MHFEVKIPLYMSESLLILLDVWKKAAVQEKNNPFYKCGSLEEFKTRLTNSKIEYDIHNEDIFLTEMLCKTVILTVPSGKIDMYYDMERLYVDYDGTREHIWGSVNYERPDYIKEFADLLLEWAEDCGTEVYSYITDSHLDRPWYHGPSDPPWRHLCNIEIAVIKTVWPHMDHTQLKPVGGSYLKRIGYLKEWDFVGPVVLCVSADNFLYFNCIQDLFEYPYTVGYEIIGVIKRRSDNLLQSKLIAVNTTCIAMLHEKLLISQKLIGFSEEQRKNIKALMPAPFVRKDIH